MSTTSTPVTTHSEAKISINTDFVLNGVQWRLTMREGTNADVILTLMRESYKATAELRKAGAVFVHNRDARESLQQRPNGAPTKPQPNGNGTQPNGNGTQPNGDHPGWCPIHQCEMTRYEKGSQSWYSHKTDDGWCRGKSKK